MWFKYVMIILFFYILAVLQNSFLLYVIGVVPNLLFVAFFIITFFSEYGEKGEHSNQYYNGFFLSIISGFFLGVFSTLNFGFSIILMVIIYFFIKMLIHFLRERQDRYLILYFLSIFFISLFIYHILLNLLSGSFHSTVDFNENIFIAVVYNMILAHGGFYGYRYIIKKNYTDNQLKLF